MEILKKAKDKSTFFSSDQSKLILCVHEPETDPVA